MKNEFKLNLNIRFELIALITIVFLFLFSVRVFAVTVEDMAPSFEIKTMKGNLFKVDDKKGKAPLFLIFWATWCPVCKEEIPKLKEFYSTFNPKGMEFLAINVGINDSEKKMKRYSKKYGMDYPLAFDEGSKITKSFNVMGTPTIIIVDRSGKVRYRDAALPKDLGAHFQSLME
ncbi:MAG: TlpA family protein disulfide reductase [Deltaproteobacteria bacterium]|nr:TlpA family protein disulfide reductase [Deltaproteobacteria bacterium]